MVEELDTNTYLCISKNEFEIYLFDIKNLNNLYSEKIIFNSKTNNIDLETLDKFLKDNIFKIEKLSGNFVKNIFLIVKNIEIRSINFGIKKKGYDDTISEKFLQNILNDAKDLFRENYKNYYIMHFLINRYLANGNYSQFLRNNFKGDNLCIELQFNFISNNFISEINTVLRKYQVVLAGCLDGEYIKNYFTDEQIQYPEMIYKIISGINENEVKIISKNQKTNGFFERFFQLFS